MSEPKPQVSDAAAKRLDALLAAAPSDPYAPGNYDQIIRQFCGWVQATSLFTPEVARVINEFCDSIEMKRKEGK